LWLRLLDTTTVVEKAIRSYLKDRCESTLPRFDVMAALDRAGRPLSMTELSNRLLVSNGNVTGVIARLSDAGLVERAADAEDKRSLRVSLTSLGRRKFQRMARMHEQLVDDVFGGLTDSEISRLLTLATELNRSVHASLSKIRR
jgi:DNA-binding MarR family transcriptional regulator